MVDHDPLVPLRSWWRRRATDRPVCIVVPALGTPARVYDRLAAALHESGLQVVVVELRGTGASPSRASRHHDWGYLDLVDGELVAAYRHVQSQADPAAPVFWLGHSLGGHLALLHQRRHGSAQPAEVLLAASGTPFSRHYPFATRAGLYLVSLMMRASHATLGYFAGHRLGFGGRQPRTLMRQWLHFAWQGSLPSDVMGDPDVAARSGFRAALSMAGDRWAPAPATSHLCSLFGAEPDVETLSSLDDGSRPDHFSWLRRPKAPAEWVCGRAISASPARETAPRPASEQPGRNGTQPP